MCRREPWLRLVEGPGIDIYSLSFLNYPSRRIFRWISGHWPMKRDDDNPRALLDRRTSSIDEGLGCLRHLTGEIPSRIHEKL